MAEAILVATPTSPLVSALVTINGHSVSIAGDYQTTLTGENAGDFSLQSYHIQHYAFDGNSWINNFTDINIENDFSGAIPSSITGPFTYDVASGDHAVGDVFIDDAFAYATLTRLTVGPVEAIPELSTWAMMLTGFAGLGFAAWQPKQQRANFSHLNGTPENRAHSGSALRARTVDAMSLLGRALVHLGRRLEPRQRRPQRIQSRSVRIPVASDDTTNGRCHRGQLVVGEVNCRHGLSPA